MKILLLLLFLKNINCHSWIDSITCYDTGSVGYIRNYDSRQNIPEFDRFMTYLLEGRNPNDRICSPNQRTNTYNSNFPRLTCFPGSRVGIVYNTNGHTFSDECLTGDPRGCKDNGLRAADTFYSIHMNNIIYPNQLNLVSDVNSNIQFNDDSGLINDIARRQNYNFNGICDNQSSEPCYAEFTIPNDIIPNREYQFIWYWILDRDYRATGEAYTSCWDINIIPRINVPTSPTPTPTRDNCNLRQ